MSSPLGEGGLESLSQVARTKQLKTARGILFFVGIVTILLNIAFVLFAERVVDSQIDKEVRELRAGGNEIDDAALAGFRESAVRSTRLVNGIAVLIGGVFIACGIYVYRYPVPATVVSLVLYLGCAAVYGVIDPSTLARGWIVKILIVVALFKAVQAALAYESERKASAAEGLNTEFPAAPI